jgi:hypothetical protein
LGERRYLALRGTARSDLPALGRIRFGLQRYGAGSDSELGDNGAVWSGRCRKV